MAGFVVVPDRVWSVEVVAGRTGPDSSEGKEGTRGGREDRVGQLLSKQRTRREYTNKHTHYSLQSTFLLHPTKAAETP